MHASTSVIALVLAATIAGCTRDGSPEPATDGTDATRPAAATPSPAPVTTTAPTASVLALSGEGVDLIERGSGAIRHLAFGLEAGRALDALTRVRGAPEDRFDNPECGAGPLQTVSWADGLSVQLQEGRFVGWGLKARAGGDAGAQDRIATVAGIGIGSTRGELEGAYATQVFESTLGTEFSAAGIYGLLESPHGEAKVTSLWAGTACIFR